MPNVISNKPKSPTKKGANHQGHTDGGAKKSPTKEKRDKGTKK